jgi:glycosyltransferase involved in cell wall biosynthesis
MRLLYIAERILDYSRNTIIKKAFLSQGIEIIECQSKLNYSLLRYPILFKKFFLNKNKKIDFIFIGFFGQPLIPLIRKFSNKPIIFDAYLSSYDTMCFDRKKFRPNSIPGKFFYWLDKTSCKLSDIILLDTYAHIDYFVNTFSLDKKKFRRLLIGADETIFYPRKTDKNDKEFRIFYYGSYKPLHGTEYIIKAAKKLEDFKNIKFEIVGRGIESEKIRELSMILEVKNIDFIDWIPYKELPKHIALSDVCLGGHFGNVKKAKRVIAGKTFQFIAMKKPVIIGDNNANREIFKNEKNCLMVNHSDGDEIAEKILTLSKDKELTNIIAKKGYDTYKEKCSYSVIKKNIGQIINEISMY